MQHIANHQPHSNNKAAKIAVHKSSLGTRIQWRHKHTALACELGAAVVVALGIWAVGVAGLGVVAAEGRAIVALGIHRIYLLLAAPFFLGIMSYFLVKWSHGYKGPSELIALLKQKIFTISWLD